MSPSKRLAQLQFYIDIYGYLISFLSAIIKAVRGQGLGLCLLYLVDAL